MSDEQEKDTEDDVDDLLDAAFAQQDLIHHKCQMRDDPAKKKEEWEKKYGK